MLSLAAPTGDTAPWTNGDEAGPYCTTGVHGTLAGAGAAISVEADQG